MIKPITEPAACLLSTTIHRIIPENLCCDLLLDVVLSTVMGGHLNRSILVKLWWQTKGYWGSTLRDKSMSIVLWFPETYSKSKVSTASRWATLTSGCNEPVSMMPEVILKSIQCIWSQWCPIHGTYGLPICCGSDFLNIVCLGFLAPPALRSGRFVRQWLVEAFWFKKGLPNKKNLGLAVLCKNDVYTGTPQSATSSNQKDRRGQFTTIWAGFHSFYLHHVPIEWTQYQGLDAIVIDKPAATGRAGYWELFFPCSVKMCDDAMCENVWTYHKILDS